MIDTRFYGIGSDRLCFRKGWSGPFLDRPFFFLDFNPSEKGMERFQFHRVLSFDLLILLFPFVFTGDKQTGPGSGSNGRSFTDGSRDRRSGTGSGSDSFGESDRRPGYTPPNEEELDR